MHQWKTDEFWCRLLANDDDEDGRRQLSMTTLDARRDQAHHHYQCCDGADSYRVDVSEDAGKTWNTVHGATLPISSNPNTSTRMLSLK